MNNETNINTILDNLSLSEGIDFNYDENAIVEEYQKQGENKSSLAIKILSIFGGFLATIAFCGFLAVTGLYNSEEGLMIFGTGFIVAAIFLNKIYDKLIIDTFSISLYIMGYVLLMVGFIENNVGENFIPTLFIFIALGTLFITQNYILSFISVLVISGSFLALIILNDAYNSIHFYIVITTLLLTFCFLFEAKIIAFSKKTSKLYDPVRIGLMISFLFGLIAVCKKGLVPVSENYIVLSSIVIILAILYLVHIILKINKIASPKHQVLVYTLSGLILLSTVFSPAISGAILIILLSFLVNYKTGFVIGIIALIYFIGQYYYDLNFTLLTKSILLFSSGILFILLYLFTTKKPIIDEKI